MGFHLHVKLEVEYTYQCKSSCEINTFDVASSVISIFKLSLSTRNVRFESSQMVLGTCSSNSSLINWNQPSSGFSLCQPAAVIFGKTGIFWGRTRFFRWQGCRLPVLASLLDCCLLSCVSEGTYILRTCNWVHGAILVSSGLDLHNSSCASSDSLICTQLWAFSSPLLSRCSTLAGDCWLSHVLEILSFTDLSLQMDTCGCSWIAHFHLAPLLLTHYAASFMAHSMFEAWVKSNIWHSWRC